MPDNDPIELNLSDIDELDFYFRPVAAINLERIRALEIELVEFQAARHESKYNGNYKQDFVAILNRASRAFGKSSPEGMSEFAGISSSTIRKIRKGYLPSETTIYQVVATLRSACKFYLERGSDGKVLSENWARVPVDASECIENVRDALNSVLVVAKGSNTKDEIVLTVIERAELIAVLETSLLLLRAPLVDTKLLTKLKDFLISSSKKAAEKQVEIGFSAAASAAGSAIATLLLKYFS